MNLVPEVSKGHVDLCSLVLFMEPQEREILVYHLFSEARASKNAEEAICEIYRMAAAGTWRPAICDLSTLVYAPLENPALISRIQKDVYRILDGYPTHRLLRVGWEYVQTFSPSGLRSRETAGLPTT